MPTQEIIDNRKEKLVDHINRILSSTESARFAVGYLFISGLESIAQPLVGVKELRLLIGNTTNRETLEQLAEGYRRLDLVAEAAEAEAYPKRTDTKRMGVLFTSALLRRPRCAAVSVRDRNAKVRHRVRCPGSASCASQGDQQPFAVW
jgi:hypothetical protein